MTVQKLCFVNKYKNIYIYNPCKMGPYDPGQKKPMVRFEQYLEQVAARGAHLHRLFPPCAPIGPCKRNGAKRIATGKAHNCFWVRKRQNQIHCRSLITLVSFDGHEASAEAVSDESVRFRVYWLYWHRI